MFKFLVQDLSNPVKPELNIDPPAAERLKICGSRFAPSFF
jgi:hypothetical protein